MSINQPIKVMYVQQSIPVRKTSTRSPIYVMPRINQVSPRPIFTCIDEIYSTGPVSYPIIKPTYASLSSSSQDSKDSKSTKTRNYRKWLLTIIIIIITICIIVIIILLAIFLTR